MINDRVASNPYEFSYTMRRKIQKKIGKFLIFILIISVTTLLFLNYILFSVSVKSDSMTPILETNSHVFISPLLVPGNPLFSDNDIITRGDIVLISPQSPLSMPYPKKLLNTLIGYISFRKLYPFTPSRQMTTQPQLRRIIGLPGDTLYITGHTVYVKPKGSHYFLTEFELSKKLYDVNYTIHNLSVFDPNLGAAADMKQCTLQEDEYFVLADNRISGLDSRIWGPIKEKEITGKALLRYFPFNKINPL